MAYMYSMHFYDHIFWKPSHMRIQCVPGPSLHRRWSGDESRPLLAHSIADCTSSIMRSSCSETNLPESDAAECCSNGSTPHNEISDHMRKQKQTRNNKQPLSEINDSISEELEKRLKEE